MPDREDSQAAYDKQQSELAQQHDERSKRLGIGKYTPQEVKVGFREEDKPKTEEKTEEQKQKAKSDKSE